MSICPDCGTVLTHLPRNPFPCEGDCNGTCYDPSPDSTVTSAKLDHQGLFQDPAKARNSRAPINPDACTTAPGWKCATCVGEDSDHRWTVRQRRIDQRLGGRPLHKETLKKLGNWFYTAFRGVRFPVDARTAPGTPGFDYQAWNEFRHGRCDLIPDELNPHRRAVHSVGVTREEFITTLMELKSNQNEFGSDTEILRLAVEWAADRTTSEVSPPADSVLASNRPTAVTDGGQPD